MPWRGERIQAINEQAQTQSEPWAPLCAVFIGQKQLQIRNASTTVIFSQRKTQHHVILMEVIKKLEKETEAKKNLWSNGRSKTCLPQLIYLSL